MKKILYLSMVSSLFLVASCSHNHAGHSHGDKTKSCCASGEKKDCCKGEKKACCIKAKKEGKDCTEGNCGDAKDA